MPRSSAENAGADSGAPWWKESVFYQIYPRSFADGDGDGVGDLNGIIEHVPDIAALGVDAIWLSPVFRSPMADFGYDVSDYCDVDPTFGDLSDMDRLIARCHEHGVRITLDWVPNHTSSRHPWFLESRESTRNDRRGWYYWRDPGPDGGPPNNWRAEFGDSPAWTFDELTGQYYLHLFLPEQPDLNWHHPAVRDAMLDTLRFWLDRGVDGFRADVVHLIGKDPALHDLPSGPGKPLAHVDDPMTHRYLREIRTLLDSYDHEPMIVGEVNLLGPGQVASYLGDGDELHLAFDFRPIRTAWQSAAFRTVIARIHDDVPSSARPTWVLSNHDVVRHATRFGDERAVRAAAFMSLTQRAVPYLYAGEELGLRDARIPTHAVVDPGGRDGCRAPIPWSVAPPHGWGEPPWLPFVDDASERAFERQRSDDGSILHLYRRLLELRRDLGALRRGSQEPVHLHDDVVAWRRSTADHAVLVAINFATSQLHVDLDGPILAASSLRSGALHRTLLPLEAVIVDLS